MVAQTLLTRAHNMKSREQILASIPPLFVIQQLKQLFNIYMYLVPLLEKNNFSLNQDLNFSIILYVKLLLSIYIVSRFPLLYFTIRKLVELIRVYKTCLLSVATQVIPS